MGQTEACADAFEELAFDENIASLLDAMCDEVVLLDANGVIVACNTAWRNFCAENGGDIDSNYLGQNYIRICAGPNGHGSTEAQMIESGLRKLLADGSEFRAEYPCDSPTTTRWFEVTAGRMIWNGQVALLVQHRNITTRHKQFDDVGRSAMDTAMLAALVATTKDAIMSYDLDCNILTWNPAARDLYGYSAEEAIGQSLEILYPPGWPKRIQQYRDEIIAGKLSSFEATRVAKDGTERRVWVTGAPVRIGSGEIIAISNIHRDVTQLRKAEEARAIIAQEVIHRSKNMLTIVSSIQRQTGRRAKSIEDFNTHFGARIDSLNSSTDLLVGGNWTTVGLWALVRRHLAPFLSSVDGKMHLDGPDVYLQPQAVQTLGMSLHELATNSVKYGALSAHAGHIDVRWKVVGRYETQPTLQFEWLETGIDFNAPPDQRGYGHTVLTTLARSMLDAEVAFDTTDTSLRWSLEVPSSHFVADT